MGLYISAPRHGGEMGSAYDDDDDDGLNHYGIRKPKNSVEVEWGVYISNQSRSILLLEEIDSQARELVEQGVFRAVDRSYPFGASMDVEGHPAERTPFRRLLGKPVAPSIVVRVRDESTIELATFGQQRIDSPRQILDVISVQGDPEIQAADICDRLKLLLPTIAR
jgi:hypothetical protein